ncbi:MAG: ArsC/Spx/MgsR family protein [Planctomycetota bacterium]
MSVTVWFNPACSKCRAVKSLLEERGIEAHYRLYLEEAPTVAELQDLITKLDDPEAAQLLRGKEAEYVARDLDNATAEARIAAAVEVPKLINRPIVVNGDRAIVARPADLAAKVLD